MREKIIDEIVQIIKSKFSRNEVDIKEELLGRNLNFMPVELAILLKELENIYKIDFDEKDILNGLFNNIYNISALIEDKINFN